MTQPFLRTRLAPLPGSGEVAGKKWNPEDRSVSRPRRAAWRQKLVEAERGFTHGFRVDSTLYAHFFVDCLLLATCSVVGLPPTHWAIVIAGITVMLSAEFFSLAILMVAEELSSSIKKRVESANAAGKLLVFLGSSVMIGIVLWLRFREFFSGNGVG